MAVRICRKCKVEKELNLMNFGFSCKVFDTICKKCKTKETNDKYRKIRKKYKPKIFRECKRDGCDIEIQIVGSNKYCSKVCRDLQTSKNRENNRENNKIGKRIKEIPKRFLERGLISGVDYN